MRNLAKRAEFRICILSEFAKISVFSDFLAKKISVFSDFLVKKISVFSDFSAEKISVFSDFFV